MSIAAGPARSSLRPAAERAVVALLLVVVLSQRFALPVGGGDVPLTVPLVLLVVLLGHQAGALVIDPVGLRLYAVAVIAVCLSTAASLATGGDPSLLSLAFLVLLYVLGVLRPAVPLEDSAGRLHGLYLGLMSVAAVVSLLQLAVQYAGVPHRDWLSALVPSDLLLSGYNTGDPVTYGSDLHRSNAVIFLEPSFLSFFLGVAVVIAVARAAPLWQVTLLVAGIVPTLAGNGIAVAALGLLVIALGPRRRSLLRLAPALVVGVVLAALTPLAELYLSRTVEISAEDTSSSLRLVQPYQLLLPDWASSPASVVLGHGAGTATDVVEAAAASGVLAPVVPKALYEYGLLGTVPLLLLLGWVFARAAPGRPWVAGVALAYLLINAALLQATLALGTLVLLALPRLSPAGAGRVLLRAEAASDPAPARGRHRARDRA